MTAYHDDEWGRPTHDDRELFELLVLEGAQAGLSWSTILDKRDGYRRAFDGFDPAVVAAYGDAKVAALLADPGIVRNRLKVRSAVTNAAAFLRVREDRGSFDAYLWDWVGGVPVVNRPRTLADVPASTPLSDAVSKDLRRRGFTFVGTTIVYAFLQSAGVVDDHLAGCPVQGVPRGSPICCATPGPAPRGVVGAADSAAIADTSALRSTDPDAARDDRDPRGTP